MSRDYILQPFRGVTDLKIDYASLLNPQQHAAVTAPPQPALVIAGAGSGKTRTLTYRVAYLIERGIAPERILLLTFTNKAAREMMRRVSDILGSDMNSLWGGTFHSIGNRILRRNAAKLGFRPDFTILDREDAKDLLKACLDDAKIEVTETRFPKVEVVGDIISMAQNTGRSIRKVVMEEHPFFAQFMDDFERVQVAFAKRKLQGNVMDFDDLLALWLKLFRENPDVLEQYQHRFQFILVDEYQDTNKLQSELIDLLGSLHKNVMVVGDDSQSIYSWRGANFQNIFEFPKRYPGAVVYKIEENYRSTPEILALANAAIAPNVNQYEKQLVSRRKSGLKPALVPCPDGGSQAAFVSQRILELRDEGIGLDDIAVLYRSHFHALELQLELTRRNIPFSITSGIRFFEQAHIKDVSALVKWIVNPSDEISLKRVICLMPGIGGKGADKLWRAFLARKPKPADPDWSVEEPESPNKPPPPPADPADPAAAHPLATALQGCASAVPKKAAVAWAQFTATVAQLEADSVRTRPAAMIKLILEAFYEEHLEETYANFRARLDDLEQLASFATQFRSVDEFLSQLALLSNLEAEEDQVRPNDEALLKLSTIHQAKGLEFSVVFIIMLCDGMFPSYRSIEKPEAVEEERRLLYVAMTRAKDELYLSYPLVRMTPNPSGDIMQQPSRFLDDLPRELLEEYKLRGFGAYG